MAFICNEVESRRMPMNNGDEVNKLLVGENVEVLRFVEGSHVCWFTGVITDCQSCYRIVKLNHEMDNGAYSRNIQSLCGSEALPENFVLVEESCNRMIRPLPPIHDIKKSEIRFGRCVDVSIKGSWREGVLIGQTNDYSKLLVFFPDMSDQRFVLASDIRLTQEWNDVSGQWRHRGLWLFLKIMKKIWQRNPVLSEFKEMWLRLKATDTFYEKIKTWHSGPKLIWKELVLDLIRGAKSVVSSILPATYSSYSVQKIKCLARGVGRLSNAGNSSLASTSHVAKCCTTTSNPIQDIKKQNHIEPHILDSRQQFLSGVEIKVVDEHQANEKFRNTEMDNDDKFILETHDNKKSLESRAWKPVKLEGKFCHDLLQMSISSHAEFTKHSLKKVKVGNPRIQLQKLRKHLLSIGWRIESKRDTMLRFRYISPEQTIYYSLIKVLQYLLKQNKQMRSKAIDKGNSKDIDSSDHLQDTSPTKADFISLMQDQKIHPIDARLSKNQQTAEVLYGESDSSSLTNCKVMQSNSPKFIEGSAQASGNCLGIINKTLSSKRNNISGVMKTYIDGGSNSMTSTANSKEEAHELPGDSSLITPNKHKSLLMQKEIFEQGSLSSFSLFDDEEFNSKEYFGKKRKLNKIKREHQNSLMMHTEEMAQESSSSSKEFDYKVHLEKKCEVKKRKIECQKSHVMQKGILEEKLLSFSNLSDSSEFNSKEQLEKERELKRKQIEHLSTKRQLRRRNSEHPNTHAVLEHVVKMDDFQVSCNQKPSSRMLTSHVLRSDKRSRLSMFLSSKDQVAKTIISWLIDKDVVLPRHKISFVRKTDGRIMKEGWITYNGIKCRCCQNVLPLSKFAAHAGSKTSRSSTSIILQDGRSLFDCQKQILCSLKSSKSQHSRLRRDFSNHEADDICTVCRDGGLLMLCDLCPSAFHPTCIGLEDVPEGNWFCPSCRCGICGLSDFNCDAENFTCNSGICCDQCERQYHVSCLQKQGLQLKECPIEAWTCSKSCSKIISHLRLLLGNPNPTHVKGLSWTILRSNIEDSGKLDVESIVENSGMLHIALDVLHECFEPLFEPRSQSDLAKDIIFNSTSELNRLNFWGFYTMLLMDGDELIGVATFRIHGKRLAEMPFICTRVKFRRQGMCRILMNELQKLLCSLGVERLILPAIPELLNMWTSTFGFTEITCYDRLEFIEHPLLTFHGTALCQKFLKKPTVSKA